MRHQDTEKGEGMFSTLVIQLQLPSHYGGGKFITERSSREAVPYYVLATGIHDNYREFYIVNL